MVISSIADMILQTATEVIHSRVPEGFEWIEQYGQYYSRDYGYFYDPNTGLFYHSETQMYYIFNDDTQEYEVYKCMQKSKYYMESPRNILFILLLVYILIINNSQVRYRGLDRAAKRRFLVGSESEKVACAPGDSNDIYAGCTAKPLPGS
uniref:OCRE domain-containing protein n=1 Tax=Heterorhabditis bacteriophora TaxID=37862 RepID=A0A1I7X074_HETBA